MLDFSRDIPVGVALAIPAQDRGVDLYRVRIVLAKVLIADGPAFTVQTEVSQITVGNVIAVDIGPRSTGGRNRPGDRAGDIACDVVGAQLGHVPARSELERGFAVTE